MRERQEHALDPGAGRLMAGAACSWVEHLAGLDLLVLCDLAPGKRGGCFFDGATGTGLALIVEVDAVDLFAAVDARAFGPLDFHHAQRTLVEGAKDRVISDDVGPWYLELVLDDGGAAGRNDRCLHVLLKTRAALGVDAVEDFADHVEARNEVRTAVVMATLHRKNIRHLPIVAGGELIGMISDRDLRQFSQHLLSDSGAARAQLRRPIGPITYTDVVTADPEDNVDQLIELMVENKVGALPVVDSDGALVGLVSYVDMQRAATGKL